jgi:hypothetical protein
MDEDAQQETRRVNEEMALAAVEFLRAVIAMDPPVSVVFTDRRRGLRGASHAGADRVAELSVDAHPGAILALGAPGLIRRLPRRQIVRHQAPGTAATQDVLNAIEHLA